MGEQNSTKGDYSFLQWRYTAGQRQLAGPECEIRLKPLLDRLLRRFLEEPGTVLTRECLIEQVWTRRQVNDEVLSRAIAELRAILGDDAREPRFIETLSKGGYRWIAEVTHDESPGVAGAARPDTPAPNRARMRNFRIAVPALATLAMLLFAWRYFADSTTGSGHRAELAVNLLSAQPLTADPRLEYDARFDALGRVVYIRSASASQTSELVMVDPASRAERVLWQDTLALRHPAPSPDGREIAVTRHGEKGCELWSVAVVDGRQLRLAACADSVHGGIEWADGGRSLIFTGDPIDAKHAPGLVKLDRSSGALHQLTLPLRSEGAHVDPRLSTDQKEIVFASVDGDDEQLWRAPWPQLTSPVALLARPEPVYDHAFEPGSRNLWIAGDLILYRALHRLRPGGQPELIGGRGARSIDIAANGAAVWSEARYDADIWLRGANDGPWTVIARSLRYEAQPEFSPDGRRIALVSNRNGAESILVYDRLSGETRQLTLDPGLRWVRPTWSARDDSLVLTAYENRQTRLYRYRLDGDMLSVIAEVEPGAFQGVELSDRLLYLVGHGTTQSTLMQLRAGQTTAENLGLGTVAAYRASSDWLAWRSSQSSDLMFARLAEPRVIHSLPLSDGAMPEAFALTGSVLTYREKNQLWSMKLPDGKPQAIAGDHVPDAAGPSIAVSANGALATVTLTSLEMDLMISAPALSGIGATRADAGGVRP